jgi:nicotinate-nucleotide adenylyltransferase
MPLGLLGGTFDPIHIGHLDIAAAARQALALERVLLIPARLPPHRHTPHASAAHRFAMAAEAALEVPGLEVSDIEMEVEGPSYTTSTLDRLAARGLDTRDMYFIIGADAFHEIRAWKNYPALLDRCRFAVVARPGWPVNRLRGALPELASRMMDVGSLQPGESPADIALIDARTAPVSSTDVRGRLARGESIGDLVPAAVAAHIAKHALYGQV